MRFLVILSILSFCFCSCQPDNYQVRHEKFKKAKSLYFDALNLKQNNQLEEALVAINKSLAEDNEYHMSYNLKGDILMGLERYQQAIDNYDEILRIKSHYTNFYFLKGKVYIKMNQIQKADESFLTAIKKSKNSASASASDYSLVAHIYLDNNMPEKTKEYLEQALKIDSKDYYTWTVYGRYYQFIKKDEDALKCYDKSIENGGPGNYFPWYQKAKIYKAQGKQKEADDCKEKGDLARAKAPRL